MTNRTAPQGNMNEKTIRTTALLTFEERDAAVATLKAQGYATKVTCYGGQFFVVRGVRQ